MDRTTQTPVAAGDGSSGLRGGPSAAPVLSHHLGAAVADISAWMESYGPYSPHPALEVSAETFDSAYGELIERLKENYPFFHPRYVGQMLKPPHPVAMIGYLATMLINPNNHALDGGPATAHMEKEVVAKLAGMFGFTEHLGHLASSGTIANLEALFIARSIHPDKGIAYSADAHYTHSRMCHLLGIPGHAVGTDARGRMDLEALETLLRTGAIGTVVLTAGTTGLGAIDPIHEAIPLCARYGARVHVDAAYGGFFRLIADDSADGVASAPYLAIADADSVVIDPHKHGLQPYGCGAVLFRDPSVQQYYRHDSPYTYYSSDELHLGEISIECSRPGASAAALWLTLQVMPLTASGLGAVLRPGRRAAVRWAEQLQTSTVFAAYQQPELDIVTYVPRRELLSEIDAVSDQVLSRGMSLPNDEATFVATYDVKADDLIRRGHTITADVPSGRILRSVLMKPESDAALTDIAARIENLASGALPAR